jgi:ribosomal protein S18 acetylase RimI-like enzyme
VALFLSNFILYNKPFQLKTKVLTTVAEMLQNIEIIRFLYPGFSLEKYESYLKEMVPHNYKQLAVFENEICIAVTGFWTGTKLWSGKYIEIDNFIVHPEHRSKGLGKMMTDYIDVKAKEEDCSMIVLDAFTGNFTAHRFYYNQGYGPKGFHFVKIINEEGLS